MDLGENWEKKAMIVLGVIFFAVVIYAYGPFQRTADVTAPNESNIPVPQTNTPFSWPTIKNSSSNNTTTTGGNGTFQISADQAKQIVSQTSGPGFTVGEPSRGNVVVNNNTVSVWIVPLLQNNVVTKEIYVDSSTGMIVGSKETKT